MEIVNTNKQYNTAAGLVYSCQYHVIFTPKYRRPVLVNGVDVRLKELILQQQTSYRYNVIEMEVMPDHVHLLLDVSPQVGIYPVVTKIKGYTSNQLRSEFTWLKSRLPSLWTRGKFISSVGAITLEVVKTYIENQKGK
jgi:putative transposase